MAEALATDGEQRARLVTYARVRFGIGGEGAEDLLQETLLELLRVEGLIYRPRGFAFQVFHRRCCLQTSRRGHSGNTGSAASEPATSSPGDAEVVESLVLLRQGFGRISASCRRILFAYYIEGRSLKETAEELALASTSVWTLVNRCIRRLRECLGPR